MPGRLPHLKCTTSAGPGGLAQLAGGRRGGSRPAPAARQPALHLQDWRLQAAGGPFTGPGLERQHKHLEKQHRGGFYPEAGPRAKRKLSPNPAQFTAAQHKFWLQQISPARRAEYWYVQSGSELSFDVYVKDFWINFHDRFSYVQDAAQEAAVANTGSYGALQNTAGINTTWDLADLTLSLGYDHQNVLSTSQQFQSTDHSSEMLVSRAGFRFHPRLTAGLEGTVSWTTYDQTVLNNNTAYSAGVYADWQPGSYFHAQPRIGYALYQFQPPTQSGFHPLGQSIQTSDLQSWYADLTVTHQVTDGVTYSLSAGHELRLGVQQADAIEDSYLRPTINWNVFQDLRVQTSLSYEHGQQGAGNVAGNLTETYDWLGGTLVLTYSMMKRLSASLSYRLTLRSSTVATREYTQNLVGIALTYQTP